MPPHCPTNDMFDDRAERRREQPALSPPATLDGDGNDDDTGNMGHHMASPPQKSKTDLDQSRQVDHDSPTPPIPSLLPSQAPQPADVVATELTATGLIHPPHLTTTTDHIPPSDVTIIATSDRPPAASLSSGQNIERTITVVETPPPPTGNSTGHGASNRPHFPDQSFAALHNQCYSPAPTLRQSSSHPGHIDNLAAALASLHLTGSRTADSSPAVTPGLFHPPSASPRAAHRDRPVTLGHHYSSPFLHHMQMVQPKETHVADVDVDPISGRKLINDYEIIDELGRGTHGKVKLGRDLKQSTLVAIKIVERFSKRRKLGRLGTKEDKVKKEVAILKKARHTNVVALLEVIDDPSRKKVYIVLEWIERGEIDWRAKAPRELAIYEARRYERESRARGDPGTDRAEAAVLKEVVRRLGEAKRKKQRSVRQSRLDSGGFNWSNEMGDSEGDVSDDDDVAATSRAEGPSTSHSPMYSPDLSDDNIAGTFLPLTTDAAPTSNDGARRENARPGLDSSTYASYASSASSARGSYNDSLRPLPSAAGSQEDVAQWTADILSGSLDPGLEYVPVMTTSQIRGAVRDVVLGLQYLHYQGIIHRDIKPPNLLTTKEGRVKISDFGVSYLGQPIHDATQREDVSEQEAQDLGGETKELAKTVGTPAFYAPELCITDQGDDALPITKAIDVWALGVTTFCMLYGRTPFVDNEFVVMRRIAEEDIYIPRRRLRPIRGRPCSSSSSSPHREEPRPPSYRPHCWDMTYEDIDDELYDLLRRLLIRDPRERITLEEVRYHPWLVADLTDKIQWLEASDPVQTNQGKKIEISNEDVKTAVVPLFLDRVRSSIKKVGERLGIGSSTSKSSSANRSRATSGAAGTSAPVTSSGESSSTNVAHLDDSRRKSLRGDEAIFSALQASREGEHAHSPAVSDPHRHYFDDMRSPAAAVDANVSPHLAPPRSMPAPQQPNPVMATSASVRTVRQSDIGVPAIPSSALPCATTHVDPDPDDPGAMARHIIRLARESSTARSPDAVDAQAHGTPSLATSHATATGRVDRPAALQQQHQHTYTPSASTTTSCHPTPPASRPPSSLAASSADHHFPASTSSATHSDLFPSRNSSTNSLTSAGRVALRFFGRSSSRSQSRNTRAPLDDKAESDGRMNFVPESVAAAPSASVPAASGSTSDLGSASAASAPASRSISDPSLSLPSVVSPSVVSNASSVDAVDVGAVKMEGGHDGADGDFDGAREAEHAYDTDPETDSDGGLVMRHRRSARRAEPAAVLGERGW